MVKLLRDNFGPGDSLVRTSSARQTVLAQGFRTARAERKLLLVNKTDRELTIAVPGAAGSRLSYVDRTTAFDPPGTLELKTDEITLRPQAVAVITFRK